jgi:phosphatidate cytidylyltransferase
VNTPASKPSGGRTSGLLQRVATALALLPVVLGATWFAPAPWLYLLFAVVGVLAANEWSAMMRLAARGRAAYTALSAVLLGLAWLLRAQWPWFAAAGVLWWLLAACLIPGFPADLQRLRPNRIALGLLGPVLWVPAVLSLTMARTMPDGPLRVTFVLVLVWAADVGAFIAGRNFGRHKLAPNVSPGKTWEGVLGGMLLVALWAAAAGSYFFAIDSVRGLLALLALAVAAGALSVVGDLGISMFKRLAGLKDSGRLLPGHGGVLDRVDSLLAAAPVLALGWYWLRP